MGMLQVALIVAVTAFTIQVLPSYFQSSLPPVGSGYAAPGWEKVAKIFRDNLDSGAEKGAAFAVYHKGELVVEFSGGYADVEAEAGWNKEMLCPLFSATKGVTAITIAVLVDRGLIEYDKPLATYWPEFGQNGKENVTLRQIMSHTAGLCRLDEKFHIKDIVDDQEKVSRILAQQKPIWEPGTQHGYHGISIGLYADQIIRRVDPEHRDISQFFHEEIAKPFDLDLYIGLPLDENHRCARDYKPGAFDIFKTRDWNLLWFFNPFGDQLFKEVLGNPTGFAELGINNPSIRAIPCGATRGFGTASSLAKLYGIIANGGMYGNMKLLSEEVIKDIVRPLTSGKDRVLYHEFPYGTGLNIITLPNGNTMFGTAGYGGQHGWGDLQQNIGWAYVTNHLKMIMFHDKMSQELNYAIYETLNELKHKY